ncbi:MAG TPA: hypothetical protein VK825_19600 [Xanthobacteraceae bacterium]|jgi:hypothetical protein|nr:hypothetical protein [Xanthobacteraceae bacterium]
MKRYVKRVLARDAGHVLRRSDLAVGLAMLQASQAAKKPKPRLSPVEFAARLAVEKALQRRRYCNAFALWRTCRDKNCRRKGACRGDPNACLQRGVTSVPRDVQLRVRRDILEATPSNIGAPERRARQSMPFDLCKGGAD